ncbi:FAD-dependent oxidoreductase [Algoriphagus sp. CAU 1675]|uniref:NAD(P)/FAD-dependent oxidoreductase n=1 Tax=Algoriphagus sp. CAU 1675 TaxID=3032597 RepID=UPI0023DB088C|nr:FAD-dependent oxidoreductase [Algoriphagus sp. CAU 1675]MDF2157155.1 FAD-dependent oxidoreductase [Algoriphagus sp. CAU 1675]
MFSYWENKHFFNYDLIVIGAGFVGLSTAIHYKSRNPKARVLVLERGVFPTGASTKNAGFACFGSLTEILDDFWSMSPDEVVDLVERRYKGLQKIRKKFGDKALSYQGTKGFELIEGEQLSALDQMESINKLLRNIFKKEVFSLESETAAFGFSDRIKAVVRNRYEGELDPGKYLNALWQLAGKLGVKILTGLEVMEVGKDDGTVLAEDSRLNLVFNFSGKKVAICTNAFTKKIWPESDLQPGRGLVMVSTPLNFEIPWEGTFHMDKGYVYFRKIDGRLLLGGARNKDFEGEKSLKNEVNPKIKFHLEKLAQEVIFPGKRITWEMEWTGIMAFGPKKSPLIQKVGEKAAAAVRLGGMGVALGWQAGKELSKILDKGN